MKPLSFAFAVMACTGLVFAQTPVTQSGKGPQKQLENKHQGAKAKPNLGTRPASNTGGPRRRTGSSAALALPFESVTAAVTWPSSSLPHDTMEPSERSASE